MEKLKLFNFPSFYSMEIQFFTKIITPILILILVSGSQTMEDVTAQNFYDDNQTLTIKEYARLSEIVSNLPKRGLAFPGGHKPGRLLTQIGDQIESLVYHKEILDKFERAAIHSHDHKVLESTHFYPFIASSNLRLYYEAKSLAIEIGQNHTTTTNPAMEKFKFVHQLAQIKLLIETKLGQDWVEKEIVRRMDLRYSLSKIWGSSVDVGEMTQIWPNILHLFSQILTYLEDKGGVSNILLFAALLNAEPELDNVLIFLAQHGFPQLIPETGMNGVALKMNIFISAYSLIYNTKGKNGALLDSKKLISKIEQIYIKIWTLFKPMDAQKTVLELQNNDLAFQLFLQFLRRPEITTGYRRITHNFETHPILEPFFDNSLNFTVLDKISGTPTLYKETLSQIIENFLEWRGNPSMEKDDENLRWTYLNRQSDLQLVQVDKKNLTKNLRINRSLLLKLHDDLQSYLKSGEVADKIVAERLMGQLSFIRAVDKLDSHVTQVLQKYMGTSPEHLGVDEVIRIIQGFLDAVSELTDLSEFGMEIQKGDELQLLGLKEIQETSQNDEDTMRRFVEAKKILSEVIETLKNLHEIDSIPHRILNKIWRDLNAGEKKDVDKEKGKLMDHFEEKDRIEL